jgi:transcriptional regulator with PAS, ATPase and Fis domain
LQTQDQTLAGLTETGGTHGGTGLVLWVAHHLDRALVGARIPLELGHTYELGRNGTALGPGILADPRISRRHLSLEVDGEQVVVIDHGSRNGTFVNGRMCKRALVGDGDVIRLGSIRLIVRQGGPDRPALTHPRILGVSDALYDLVAEAQVVGPRDTLILLCGEPGVGKDLLAREIHRASHRGGPFIASNCGGIAETVIQSEFFGHIKGAFTGAETDRAGLVASADGGTLFLDEIGNAPPTLQQTLLRLLENHEYRPVGSDEIKHLTARLVAATNADLQAAVEQGSFRSDLWSRVSRWVLDIPPLRKPPEDIMPIATALARRFGAIRPVFEGALVDRLLAYNFPNNVRELEGLIERLVATNNEGPIRLRPWIADILPHPTRPKVAVRISGAPPRRSNGKSRPSKDELLDLLATHNGNKSEVAAELKIQRNTLYRWLSDAGIR